MPREYTKMELLSENVFRRKAVGETNKEQSKDVRCGGRL